MGEKEDLGEKSFPLHFVRPKSQTVPRYFHRCGVKKVTCTYREFRILYFENLLTDHGQHIG
jgi:hypothetical protein